MEVPGVCAVEVACGYFLQKGGWPLSSMTPKLRHFILKWVCTLVLPHHRAASLSLPVEKVNEDHFAARDVNTIHYGFNGWRLLPLGGA